MFESSHPELRVLAIPIMRCRGSNPATPTGQSVSNAYRSGPCSKCRDIAVFPSSIWSPSRKSGSGALSLKAYFGVSFYGSAYPLAHVRAASADVEGPDSEIRGARQ